jgi:4-hydroxy-2-oxoheptanedioate aldolase
MCRVAWLEPGIIMKLLDAGAFRHRLSDDQYARRVRALRRCVSLSAAGLSQLRAGACAVDLWADYFKNSNDSVITMAMIETKQAVENLEDILTVPGLDSIYIGPNDLAISYGYGPSGVPTDKEVLDKIKYIVDTAKKHKIYAGIHTGSTKMAKEMIALGFQYVTLLADNAFLASAAKAAVQEMREGGEGAKKAGGMY